MDKKILAILAAAIVVLAGVGVAIALSNNNQCTVTFDYNYEDRTVKTSYTYDKNSTITNPEIPEIRLGHYFVYWCSDSETTKEVDFPYRVTGDVTFYAKWSTTISDKYFYPDYLTNTESGKALVQSNKVTTGANTINGNSIVGAGSTFAIIKDGSDKYTVIDSINVKELFKIPSNSLQLTVFSHNKSNTEFFCVQYSDGYYMYDLKGNSYGPSSSKPVMALADTVLFDNAFYRFDSDGNMYWAFADNAYVHMPNGGNGKLFYELETTTDATGNVKGYAINILDSNYTVVNTVKCSAPADYYSCVTMSNGKFLAQYAVQVSNSSTDFTFKESASEKKYKMHSFIIDDKDCKEIKMLCPVIVSMDRYNAPAVDWDLYSNDTVSIVQMGVVTQGGVLSEKYITAKISSEGKTVTKLYETILEPLDAILIKPIGDGSSYVAWLTGKVEAKTETIRAIIDGSGGTFKVVMAGDKALNIGNPNSAKYFIAYSENEKTRTDYNIYDVHGNVVAKFDGMTYMGSSTNDLFFHDNDSVYIYRGDKVERLCAYDTNKPVYIYAHCYSYYDGAKYVVQAENGSTIDNSTNGIVSSYKLANGEILISFENASKTGMIFKLTT